MHENISDGSQNNRALVLNSCLPASEEHDAKRQTTTGVRVHRGSHRSWGRQWACSVGKGELWKVP